MKEEIKARMCRYCNHRDSIYHVVVIDKSGYARCYESDRIADRE